MALSFPGLRTGRTEPIETRASVNVVGSLTDIITNGGRLSNLSSDLSAYHDSELIYRCARMNAAALASLDLALKVRNGAEEEEVWDDPTANLYNQSSSDAVNAVVRKRIVYERAEILGESFVYIEREDQDNPQSAPKDFHPIFDPVAPVAAEPEDQNGIRRARTTVEKIAQGLAGYIIQTKWGDVPVLPHEILWLRYPSFDAPWASMAPGRAARPQAQMVRELRKWNWAQVRNGMKPSGVYNMGSAFDAEAAERVKAQLLSKSGPDNGYVPIVTGGAEGDKPGFTRTSLTPDEVDYLSSIKASERTIGLVMEVPLEIVFGEVNYANRSNAETAWWGYLKDKQAVHEAEIDRVLFPDPRISAFFDLSKVSALQENQDQVQERATKAWMSDGLPWRRYLEQLGEEVPENDPRLNLTYTSFTEFSKAKYPELAGMPGEQKAQAKAELPPTMHPAAAAIISAPRAIEARARANTLEMDEVIARTNQERRIAKAVKQLAEAGKNRALKRPGKRAKQEDTPKAEELITAAVLTAMANDYLAPKIEDAWESVATRTADAAGIVLTAEQLEAIEEEAQSRANFAIESIVATTLAELTKRLAEPEEDEDGLSAVTVAVLATFAALAAARAKLISEQETTAAMSGASMAVMATLSKATKTWRLGQGDHCVSCPKLNGKTVKLSERFNARGLPDFADNERPRGPQDSHFSCRCWLAYGWG